MWKSEVMAKEMETLNHAIELAREDAAKRIFAELDEIAEVECGMSLESVLIRMPRNKKSVKKYEALKKKYGVD